MPKTDKVVACSDPKNHRTEYQLLINILVDKAKGRSVGDWLNEHDEDNNTLKDLKEAVNNNADTLDTLIKCIYMLLELLVGVLTEDDLNKILIKLNEIKKGNE